MGTFKFTALAKSVRSERCGWANTFERRSTIEFPQLDGKAAETRESLGRTYGYVRVTGRTNKFKTCQSWLNDGYSPLRTAVDHPNRRTCDWYARFVGTRRTSVVRSLDDFENTTKTVVCLIVTEDF